jgi:hypothetical protein
MTAMAGKLSVDASGRLRGPASITYNEPWPCPNGGWGMEIPKGVLGVVMHTMVGNLPGTISVFNQPSYQASAHFGIDQNGHIHQFGPVNGWIAWAEVAGNQNWYSIEHADNGNPDNPLTDAQLTASAQVVEALASFGHFPLQEANSPGQEGYGVHSMGGAAWGGHTCPDSPPRHIRSQQRPEILRRAQALRQNHEPPTPPTPGGHVTVVSDGTSGLAGLAAKHGSHPATMLRITAEAALPLGEYVAPLATYINTVFATDNVNMPDNLVLHYQEKWSAGVWRDFSWQTGHAQHPEDPQPLHALAQHLGTDAESMIRLTAEKNADSMFTGAGFDYINGVFSRSQVILPAGLTLYIE